MQGSLFGNSDLSMEISCWQSEPGLPPGKSAPELLRGWTFAQGFGGVKQCLCLSGSALREEQAKSPLWKNKAESQGHAGGCLPLPQRKHKQSPGEDFGDFGTVGPASSGGAGTALCLQLPPSPSQPFLGARGGSSRPAQAPSPVQGPGTAVTGAPGVPAARAPPWRAASAPFKCKPRELCFGFQTTAIRTHPLLQLIRGAPAGVSRPQTGQSSAFLTVRSAPSFAAEERERQGKLKG